MLMELNDHKPQQAVKFGFMQGHQNEQKLRYSLRISRNTLVFRVAYLAFLVLCWYQWDKDLVDQEWRKELVARCAPTWVDSVWDAIYRQCRTRNFVGVVLRPLSTSVRWVRSALKFGVPIWVWFPSPGCYMSGPRPFLTKREARDQTGRQGEG